MDCDVDPRRVWYQANLDQDVVFERNINIWFGWLAKYDSVYHLGATRQAVSRLFYKTQFGLEGNPIGGVVGPDEWNDIFLGAAYYQQTWLDLGGLFAEWIHNPDAQSTQDVIDAYEGADSPGDDNGYAGYLAVTCSDAAWQQPFKRVVADNWAVFSKAPFVTWSNAWFNGPCSWWPGRPATPVQVNGSHISNALLIDETLDAATPFPGSLEVRKLFPHSVLLAEPGGTTDADSLSGNLCVDGTVADYLTTGALPARNNSAPWDKTCAPLPWPRSDGCRGARGGEGGEWRRSIGDARRSGARPAASGGSADRLIRPSATSVPAGSPAGTDVVAGSMEAMLHGHRVCWWWLRP